MRWKNNDTSQQQQIRLKELTGMWNNSCFWVADDNIMGQT